MKSLSSSTCPTPSHTGATGHTEPLDRVSEVPLSDLEPRSLLDGLDELLQIQVARVQEEEAATRLVERQVRAKVQAELLMQEQAEEERARELVDAHRQERQQKLRDNARVSLVRRQALSDLAVGVERDHRLEVEACHGAHQRRMSLAQRLRGLSRLRQLASAAALALALVSVGTGVGLVKAEGRAVAEITQLEELNAVKVREAQAEVHRLERQLAESTTLISAEHRQLEAQLAAASAALAEARATGAEKLDPRERRAAITPGVGKNTAAVPVFKQAAAEAQAAAQEQAAAEAQAVEKQASSDGIFLTDNCAPYDPLCSTL